MKYCTLSSKTLGGGVIFFIAGHVLIFFLPRASPALCNVFPSPLVFAAHKVCHAGDKSFPCRFCHRVFSTNIALHYHWNEVRLSVYGSTYIHADTGGDTADNMWAQNDLSCRRALKPQ